MRAVMLMLRCFKTLCLSHPAQPGKTRDYDIRCKVDFWSITILLFNLEFQLSLVKHFGNHFELKLRRRNSGTLTQIVAWQSVKDQRTFGMKLFFWIGSGRHSWAPFILKYWHPLSKNCTIIWGKWSIVLQGCQNILCPCKSRFPWLDHVIPCQ